MPCQSGFLKGESVVSDCIVGDQCPQNSTSERTQCCDTDHCENLTLRPIQRYDDRQSCAAYNGNESILAYRPCILIGAWALFIREDVQLPHNAGLILFI
jgi:hypothetical protein